VGLRGLTRRSVDGQLANKEKSNLTDATSTGVTRSAREWASVLSSYREPSASRSAVELAITVTAFCVAWAVMWATLGLGYILTLLLAIPTAGLLVRLFVLQHDCGHGAFFRTRNVNDWVGRVIGAVTLTPYDAWRRSHNAHHASSGNLDERGIGDIDTLTVREYLALPRWRRLRYRSYRHPLVMFGIGPAYLFLVRHRLPVGYMRKGWEPWISTMATNAATALLITAMIWLVGVGPFLLVHLPVVLLAASMGVWLFYVQHQFEETSWAEDPAWNMHEAALHGSSHYELPAVLRWFTANIGVHHVHHLCSRIPFYRLPEVLRDHPELSETSKLTIKESLDSVRLVLWDEERRQLISFRDLQQRGLAG
jgi:omega-6 fatty acid desaturase (delta-12 desaturase)